MVSRIEALLEPTFLSVPRRKATSSPRSTASYLVSFEALARSTVDFDLRTSVPPDLVTVIVSTLLSTPDAPGVRTSDDSRLVCFGLEVVDLRRSTSLSSDETLCDRVRATPSSLETLRAVVLLRGLSPSAISARSLESRRRRVLTSLGRLVLGRVVHETVDSLMYAIVDSVRLTAWRRWKD